MTKKQAIQLIDKANSYLANTLNNQSMTPLWDHYLGQNANEEKSHRRFCPPGVHCGLTSGQAARLFAVRQVAQFVSGEPTPPPSLWLRLRPSYLTACALVAEYGTQIRRTLAEGAISPADLLALDYAQLNA